MPQTPSREDFRKRHAERRKQIVKDATTPRVRVIPASPELRKALTHPIGNIGFGDTGSVEWPLDSFTRRRIADGTVKVEEDKKPASKPAGPPS